MENTVNPEINENGSVNISDEVVSVIASLAASAVEGVAGMVSSISGGFAELLGKKNPSKGVKVSVTDKDVTIDLAIIVEYGTKIPDIAWEIQEKVKSEVEAMTGLHVVAVNISVDGVNVPKAEKEEKIQEMTAEVPPAIEDENAADETSDDADEIAVTPETQTPEEKEIDA